MADHLERFLKGLSAAVFLLNKAIEKQSALECIVLQANIIDGMLKIGLILKSQLQKGSADYDDTLLKQDDDDKATSERSIYKRCFISKVIGEELFKSLEEVYQKRNRCIHRYLLCEIDYDYATRLVFALDAVMDGVKETIAGLEKEQIEKGVGMTAMGEGSSRESLLDFASGKEKRHNLESGALGSDGNVGKN
jgi:hypothetical protein